jgi:CubicO group peptidase (beta-lactamase class C family)
MTGTLSQAGVQRLHRAMSAHVEKGELPGLVTLVADGEDVQVDLIGTTAFSGDEPMRRDTIFRIASVTKPMLAAVAMMLVEDGVLTLTEPVDRLLPELADRRVLARVDGPLDETVPAERPVTVEDLLTFRMGHGHIVEPAFNPPYPIIRAAEDLQLTMAQPDPRTPHDPDEWIKLFGTLPLMYQPGARWQYNTSALVLGVLVARAAGRPLAEVFRTRLFAPLGMTATGFWLPAEQARRLPSYYMTNFSSGELELQQVSGADEWTRPPAFPSGASGLASTVDDVLAFARLLLNRGVHEGTRLLSERSVELMTTNQLTPDQLAGGGPLLSGHGWGYGMAVAVAPDDVSDTPGRYGWDGGYGTSWFNDPARGRVGILLSQNSDVLFNGTISEFARLALRA